MNERLPAFKLRIPDKDRKWFRMLGLLTGITTACDLTSIESDGDVAEDDISFLDIILSHDE